MCAKRWSEDEDAVLAELSRNRLRLSEHMHRLPGRTYYGARKHADLLQLTFRNGAWTRAEQAALRKIYRSNESVKHAVARLLPGRTYTMAKAEARRLGITGAKRKREYGYSAIFRGVERLLKGGKRMTISELAASLGVSICGVRGAVEKQHGKRIRVVEYPRVNGGSRTRRWALGAGPDELRPRRKTAKEACSEYRARQRIRAGAVNPFATMIATAGAEQVTT
jgi:hypothetical protein